jgi:hypothetical protein
VPRFGFLLLALGAALSSPALPQPSPAPVTYLNGQLAISLTAGDDAVRNANRFRRAESPFSEIQLRLFADVVFDGRLTLFNQMLIDPSSRAGLASFLRSYLRYTLLQRPGAELHLQAGKLPTSFGNWAPRSYPDRNPLIGLPLLYHYFTTLRANQLPADNADLLSHRGQGQATAFGGFAGGGSTQRFNGLPLVYDTCWDFGLQVLGSLWRLEYLVALTQGTLSDPRSSPGDNNDGQQVVLRLSLVPFTGGLLGFSWARGPYLDQAVEPVLRARGLDLEDFHQVIWGLDAEYSIRHLFLAGELALNRWEMPTTTDLEAYGWYLEAKYKLRPGLYAALRHSRLGFGKIPDGNGAKLAWDYDVQRWEAGLGHYLTEGAIAKLVWQGLDTRAPLSSPQHLMALQVIASF